MNEGIRRRLQEQTGDLEDLLELLSRRLSARDLQSLLLEVFQRRAAAVTPQALLERYLEDRFVCAGPYPADRLNALEQGAFQDLGQDWQIVELSPVAPLGACSVLAAVHQNNVVSTSRLHDVCADPSNSLALECARLRKLGRTPNLAGSKRVLRAQAFPKRPGYYAHFRILALCSAGRRGFEAAALDRHLGYYTRFLAGAFPDHPLVVRFTDLGKSKLSQQLRIPFELDPNRESGRNYYRECCFKIWVGDQEVGDGGFVDWNQKLLSDAREGLLTSGLGLERLAALSEG